LSSRHMSTSMFTFFLYSFFFFSSRRRHTRSTRDWSSDVCSSDLDTCSSALGLRQTVRRFLRHRYRGALDQRPQRESALLHGVRQIGRASCRERVEMSVGGGDVNKKIGGEKRDSIDRYRVWRDVMH